ncbi:MAG: sensor histidine kinase, partial [Cyclobacteriaceae bacterium]|nr:sensor histidine kinase [Cyclobacteriaceae bacterium]
NDLKSAIITRNYLLISALVLAMVILVAGFLAWRKIQQQRQQAFLREQKIRLREVQLKAVIDSQEQERKRFASDLHDGMGQLVSALQLNIESIRARPDLGEAVSLVENSGQLLGEIQQEIRNIAFNLMPPVLVKEGLIPAVRELARKVSKASAIKADVAAHEVPARLPEVVEISLYRILQELVSNIVKHAQATSIVISFTGFSDELVLTVEDNGMGYDVDAFRNSTRSNGWRTIQTRINLIHGEIEFDTVPGRKNNTVLMHIPTRPQPVAQEPVAGENT